MSTAHNTKRPTTLIVYGANVIGAKLAELLSTQKSNIIVVDEFTKQTKNTLRTIKLDNKADTYDISGIASLTKDIKRLDYVFILLDQYLTRYSRITNKQFLSASNTIDALFKFALDQGAKVVLTSSIEVHRHIAGETSTSADTLKDARADSNFSRTELQKYCENLAAEYHDQALLDVRITRVGELLGEGIPLDNDTILSTMLNDAITTSRISIPGEGLDYSYYIHYLDAVYGIIKSLFSNKTNGEVFSLSYPEEISSLNLAYKILELNPKASEIQFSEAAADTKLHHIYVPAKNLSKIGWTPKVTFEEALVETVDYVHKKKRATWEKRPELSKSSQEDVRKSQPLRSETMTPLGKVLNSVSSPIDGFRKKVRTNLALDEPVEITTKRVVTIVMKVIIGALLFFGLIAPLLQLTIGIGGTAYYAQKGSEALLSLDTTTASNRLEKASDYSSLAKTGWDGFRWIKVFSATRSFYDSTQDLFSGIEHLSSGALYLSQGLHPYAQYFKNFEPVATFGSVSGGGSREYREELDEMSRTTSVIERASTEITMATGILDTLDTGSFPSFAKSYIEELRDKADSAEDAVSTLKNFAYSVPDLLGKDGRKTYVVLFQNPMELRSTGGWLTSVAIIGIERGQVRELTVKDVYDIDGQLQEDITPPETMVEALDVTDWTLSLSNWSPEFPQAAEAAEYFLTLSEDITRADGVIAVDLEFIRSLIDVWGEVNVPGEVEPVTAENLYDKVIEIHRNFTPGSDQKPVFLSNLANELMYLILSSPSSSWPTIGEKLAEGLKSKHVLLNLRSPEIAEYINAEGWGGTFGGKENILYPVEWNWGSNKANHFISRSYLVETAITDTDALQQTIQISYVNSSKNNSYPEGDYKNYIRVYIPDGAQVTRTEGISSPSLTRNSGSDYDILSGWITVPVNSTVSAAVSYRLGGTSAEGALSSTADTMTYTLNMVKQPGTGDDPVTIKITYPPGWQPINLEQVSRELDTLVHRSELTSDITFVQTWQK